MVHARRITILSAIFNGLFFLLKAAAGLAAGSVAVLADSLNSLLDMLYNAGILSVVNRTHVKADKGYSFRMGQAWPMLTMAIAMLMAITAFEVFRSGLTALSSPVGTTLNWPIIFLLIIPLAGNFLLSNYMQQSALKTRSPALLESAHYSMQDIIITLIALAGVVFSSTGIKWMDGAAAMVIALFILRDAWKTAKESVAYRTGESPSRELTHHISQLVSTVRGVRGIHTIEAHSVGNFLHIDISIFVSGTIKTLASHRIAAEVQQEIERLPQVSKAFVVVEPRNGFAQ